MKKILIILTIWLVFAGTADALTTSQINSILNLLTAFGVDSATLANVELALDYKQPKNEVQKCAELSVSWQRVREAEKYYLYRNNTLVYQGTDLSFRDKGLVPGGFYSYVLLASNRAGLSEKSEIKKVYAPLVCPPQTPTLSLKREPCGGNITLFWDRISGAVTYRILRNGKEIWRGSQNRFIDKDLRVNREYSYRIQAGNQGGWSPLSFERKIEASDICPPPAPEFVEKEIKKEGDLRLELRSRPGDETRVREGSSNRSVISLDLEAIYSDITIERVNFLFDKNIFPYVEKARLRTGWNTLKEIEIERGSLSRVNGQYRLSFSGLNCTISEGNSRTLTLQVSAKEDVEVEIEVSLARNAIRAIDEIGIRHYAPSSFLSRTFFIE